LDFPNQGRYETEYITPRTILAAERWLEQNYDRKDNFFLYVDVWDPHEDWNPPKYYSELYCRDFNEKIAKLSPEKKRLLFCYPPYDFWRDRGLTEGDLDLAHAAYCGEITMVDRWIGHLLEKMENMNLLENTVVIFTSDHGFYFGEHGIFGKHLSPKRFSPLYKEDVQIPLIIHVPNLKPARRDALVSSADIMPTILELAGVKKPPSVHGKSLVTLLQDPKCEVHEIVASSWPLFNPLHRPSTVTSKERWTLIYGSEDAPAELYNLNLDPNQENNLIQEERDLAQTLLNKFISKLKDLGTSRDLLKKRQRLPR